MSQGSFSVPREVLRWVQSLDLAYSLKNVKRDLANGFLIAEIISRYHGNLIAMHSYENGHSMKTKKDNWNQLSKIFRSKIVNIPSDFLSEQEISLIVKCEEGVAGLFLCKLYELLTGKQCLRSIIKHATSDKPDYAKDNSVSSVRKALQYNDIHELSDTNAIAQVSAMALDNHEKKIQYQRQIMQTQQMKQEQLSSTGTLGVPVSRLTRTAPVPGLPYRGSFEDDRKAQQILFAKSSSLTGVSAANNNQTEGSDSIAYKTDSYYHDHSQVDEYQRMAHTSPAPFGKQASRVRSNHDDGNSVSHTRDSHHTHPNHKSNDPNEGEHITASTRAPLQLLDYKNSELNNYVVDMDKRCHIGWSDRLEPLENYLTAIELLAASYYHNSSSIVVIPTSANTTSDGGMARKNSFRVNVKSNIKKLKDMIENTVANIKFECSNIVDMCLKSKNEFVILTDTFLKLINMNIHMDDTLFNQTIDTFEQIGQEICDKNNSLSHEYLTTVLMNKIVFILLTPSIGLNGLEQYKRIGFLRILYSFVPSSNIQKHINFIHLLFNSMHSMSRQLMHQNYSVGNDLSCLNYFMPNLQILCLMETFYHEELYNCYFEYCYKVLQLAHFDSSAVDPAVASATTTADQEATAAAVISSARGGEAGGLIKSQLSSIAISHLYLSPSPRLVATSLSVLATMFTYSFSLPLSLASTPLLAVSSSATFSSIQPESVQASASAAANINGQSLTKAQMQSTLSHIQSLVNYWGRDLYHESKVHILSIFSIVFQAMTAAPAANAGSESVPSTSSPVASMKQSSRPSTSNGHTNITSSITAAARVKITAGAVAEDGVVLRLILDTLQQLFHTPSANYDNTAAAAAAAGTSNELDIEVLKYAAYALAYGTHLADKYAQVIVRLLVNTILPQLKAADASSYSVLLYTASISASSTNASSKDANPITLVTMDSSLDPIHVYPIPALLSPAVHWAFEHIIAEVNGNAPTTTSAPMVASPTVEFVEF